MGYVDYESRGMIGLLQINRPETLNALNSAVLEDLSAALDQMDLSQVRCQIVRGAGEK